MLPEDKVENTSRIEHYLESDTAEDDEEFSVKTLTQQNFKEILKVVDPTDPLHRFNA